MAKDKSATKPKAPAPEADPTDVDPAIAVAEKTVRMARLIAQKRGSIIVGERDIIAAAILVAGKVV